jgi:DNA-directed RNA polymerase beta subunit
MFLTMITDVKGRVEGRITCNTILGTTIVTLAIGKKWQTLKVGLQHLGKQSHIPLFVLYKLLGYNFDMAWEMIRKFVADPKYLNRIYIILQSSAAKAEGTIDPLEYLRNKLKKVPDEKDPDPVITITRIQTEIRDNIIRNLFAHVPYDPVRPEASIKDKLLHLSLMTAKMCEYLIGQRLLDDRDSWSNKRLESAGRSMEQLFNGLWEKMTRESQENINKGHFTGIDAVEKTLNQSTLTDEFISSFGSNSWGVKGSYVKENITESLKRDTPLAVYSQIGRVNTPASRQAKQPAIRMVQPSQLGYVCLEGNQDYTGQSITDYHTQPSTN